jgi:hypothetical protein
MNDEGLIMTSSASIPVINIKKEYQSQNRTVTEVDEEGGIDINRTMITQPSENYLFKRKGDTNQT